MISEKINSTASPIIISTTDESNLIPKADAVSGIASATSVKGGVGKSTMIINLIITYSKKQKVNVIDLDKLQSVTTSLRIREKRFGDRGMSNINLMEPRSEKELIDMMLKNQAAKELLLIDLAGFDGDLNRLAISGSDVLLTATNDAFFELNGFERFSRVLDEINQEIRNQHNQELITNVVISKIHPNVKNLGMMRDFVNKHKNFVAMDASIKYLSDYMYAPGAGESVIEYSKGRQVKERIAAINFLEFQKEFHSILKG